MSLAETSLRYKAYGLSIASTIELPELSVAGSGHLSNVDITIEKGNVTERLTAPLPETGWCFAKAETCILRFKDIGLFLIENGCRILVEKASNATYEDLTVFVVGSALATAMHQRGILALHVSAVLGPMGVIAFTGDSGAGKSTMAAHINRLKGWSLISDDVSRLHLQESDALLESGVNTVKLWTDALNSLGRSSEGLKRDMLRFDKFHAIDKDKFVSGKFPLKRLVLLTWGEEQCMERLSGRRAFQAVMSAFYRPELATLCGNRDRLVEAALRLSSMIDVFALTRIKSMPVEESVVDSIENAFSELKTVG